MARPKKHLTRAYPLKVTDSEDETVEKLRAQFAQYDIKLSYNDTVRALIRHGFDPAPADSDGVQRAIERHLTTCEWCSTDHIRCPFFWRLIALRNQFERTQPPPRAAAGRRRSILPPPPGKAGAQ